MPSYSDVDGDAVTVEVNMQQIEGFAEFFEANNTIKFVLENSMALPGYYSAAIALIDDEDFSLYTLLVDIEVNLT